MHMKFKSHIQGLRALSIISVLIYHLEISILNFKVASGGFLGVDIFFVISGYLITSIILENIKNNSFSFINFYTNRAKRLLPALLILIFSIIILAIFILDLKSFNEFLETVYSSIAFYSNFLFWTEDAYSAEPSRLKFLLHTWSLSIEEQFYIFFPMLIFFTFKKSSFAKIIILIFIISLLLSSVLVFTHPTANFFLMPTRIWEFLAGTLAYILRDDFKQKIINLNKYIIDFLFLLLILFILFYKIDFYHPSIITFVPILIISILLINDNTYTVSNKILTNKVSIFVGNISYSLYLWHFPVLVILRYYNLENSPLYISSALIFIFIISSISYFYIENKFRKIGKNKFLLFLFGILITIFSIILVLSFKVKTNEININNKDYNINFEKEKRWVNYKKYCKENSCSFNKLPNDNMHKILFVGDSLVPDAINLMRFKNDDKYTFAESEGGGCPPFQDLDKIPKFTPDRERCIKTNELRFTKNFYSNIDSVIINNLFGWYKFEELENYIIYLKKIGIKKIVVIGNYIVLKKDIIKTFTVKDSFTNNYNFKSKFVVQQKLFQDNIIEKKSKQLDFLYISYRDLCDDTCILFSEDGFPFTLDQFHFTYQFANFVSNKLEIRERILVYFNN